MEQTYEYRLLYDFLYHSGGGMRIFDFKIDHNRDAFMENLSEHMKTITEPYLNDGWQIISHSITLVDDVFFLSILVQRCQT